MHLFETKVYGGRLKNRAQLLASSSGGAFTALSDIALAHGDAIVCSSYNFNTHQQEFKLITTTEERNKARGSKYIQSIPGNVFEEAREWLKTHPERGLIFFGMGCQSAGFQSYAEMNGFRNRITVVDLICHGSPSPLIWKEYAKELEAQYGSMMHLTFKDKRKGWKHPTAVAGFNNSEISLNQYVRLFYNRLELRPSCHKCPYASTERKTDITIGDFWHIEDRIPEQYEEMGTSLFLIHTERGQQLFELAKISLNWFESNVADCLQSNLENPTPVAEGRDEFWREYQKKGVLYIMKKYGSSKLIVKLKKKIKNLLQG